MINPTPSLTNVGAAFIKPWHDKLKHLGLSAFGIYVLVYMATAISLGTVLNVQIHQHHVEEEETLMQVVIFVLKFFCPPLCARPISELTLSFDLLAQDILERNSIGGEF
jgi:hypothetical protein